jgi:hypothetical protein
MDLRDFLASKFSSILLKPTQPNQWVPGIKRCRGVTLNTTNGTALPMYWHLAWFLYKQFKKTIFFYKNSDMRNIVLISRISE